MTVAQCTESPQRSSNSVIEPLLNGEHDAIHETATMSSHGLQDACPITSDPSEIPATAHDATPLDTIQHAQTQTDEICPSDHFQPISHSVETGKLANKKRRTPARRIQFGQFAEQLRQQQYFENRKHLLNQRKRLLQKTVTLSARLHRVSAWIRDGLVETLAQSDASGFTRVYRHFQDLVDQSYGTWDCELYALDPLGRCEILDSEAAGSPKVLPQLTSSAQADILELLSYLRSNPRFLVERFRLLTPAQITSLWNPPRPQGPRNASESQYGSFTHAPLRTWDQRMQLFSKALEDYASKLERSNPLSFLLFNVYGTDQSSTGAENQLRLSTWSKVCAELMLTSERAYQSLIIPLLDRFASLYEWRAKDSVELFLMDTLQRGSFLLDQSLTNQNPRQFVGHNPLRTPEARRFFENAVKELFLIFVKYDGGFPTGALEFASAMLDRLPEDLQLGFRGTFFSSWFIEHFLQTVLCFPENENMLLKFHISKGARKKILHQLYITVQDRVHDVFYQKPIRPVDPEFRSCIEEIIGWVDSVKCENPYTLSDGHPADLEGHVAPSITVSMSEIVQLLESISPQSVHGVGSYDQLLETPAMFNSNHGQYTLASQRFDQLKNLLNSLAEPGSSMKNIHLCDEEWLQIDIDSRGRPKSFSTQEQSVNCINSIENNDLDCAQQGAIRLFKEQVADTAAKDGTSYRSDLMKAPSLKTLFREMAILASAKVDPRGWNFWNRAADTLREKYPLSSLIEDDSAVLRAMLQRSKALQAECREHCSSLEVELSTLEGICQRIRSAVNRSIDRFNDLRLKLWYFAEVVLSNHYDAAKNIARALNNMALMPARNNNFSSNSSFINGRPMSARSVASSTFERPYEDTMNMIKAPSSQGGPSKLADEQIEITNKWLTQFHIENFCKGEERIHRFCMEIDYASRRLAGDNLSEGPTLWVSELFAYERSLYRPLPMNVTSAPASLRSPSLMNYLPVTYPPSEPIQRSADSFRTAPLEDRRINGSSRFHQNYLPPELAASQLASSLGSLSRAHSATTAESISSVFSSQPSNTRSFTSPSIGSRPGSVFNDSMWNRPADVVRGKARFLEKVQKVLVCLLLSDLGCPVWTMGSETDAMLKGSHDTPLVNERLKQRFVAESLADISRFCRSRHLSTGRRPRSKSASTDASEPREDQRSQPEAFPDERLADLSLLLTKLGQQVDPVEKISVIEEFYDLSLTTLQPSLVSDDVSMGDHRILTSNPRRSSLGDRTSSSRSTQQSESEWIKYAAEQKIRSLSVHQIVQHLKLDLARLQPKTLFRDLQYISAFVSPEVMDSTPRGKALLQVGLAALAYKDEVCRSMVDVADKMYAQVRDPQSQPQMMLQVARLWMSAAREGNPVAQRELGLVYLSQPRLLPAMSLPLFKPSQVFQIDLLWHERHDPSTDLSALRLALHWLQQASKNGDKVATQKLEQRRGGISIR